MTDKFLSTPSARRATTCCRCGAACGAYFYPRPPRGGRRSAAGLEGQAGRFLSTPSARRATPMSRSICARRSKFLSTPSARRATLYNHRHAHCCQISIHALREEGDQRQPCIVAKLLYFYPRPPRGGRLQPDFAYWLLVGFLSTPSARRATWVSCTSSFFSSISIHALREEGDNAYVLWQRSDIDFYPRPPRGGRLFEVILMEAGHGISIHALREEGDPPGAPAAAWRAYFYPRPPRGGRRGRVRHRPQGVAISIHALREEGDGRQHVHSDVLSISIHALREEGDSVGPSTSPSATYFYPRPPRGGRLEMGCGKTLTANFYPRPPRGGRPPRNRCRRRVNRISIHALREEGDLAAEGAFW